MATRRSSGGLSPPPLPTSTEAKSGAAQPFVSNGSRKRRLPSSAPDMTHPLALSSHVHTRHLVKRARVLPTGGAANDVESCCDVDVERQWRLQPSSLGSRHSVEGSYQPHQYYAHLYAPPIEAPLPASWNALPALSPPLVAWASHLAAHSPTSSFPTSGSVHSAAAPLLGPNRFIGTSTSGHSSSSNPQLSPSTCSSATLSTPTTPSHHHSPGPAFAMSAGGLSKLTMRRVSPYDYNPTLLSPIPLHPIPLPDGERNALFKQLLSFELP